jgi:integrase
VAHVREVARKAGRAYEVRWVAAGRERQRTFPVRRDAERFALRIENELAEGNSTETLIRRSKTVREVVESSLAASEPKLKPRTYISYVQSYDRRILPTFGPRSIATVTSEEVERWIAGLTADGLSPATVRNHYVALNKMFRYARRHRLITYNPCEGVELPRLTNGEAFAPVFLSAGDVERLAKELDAQHPYGTLVRFASYTGLRAAEVAGLRVRDVNLAAGHIEVRQTLQRVRGEWAISTPKSARSTRNVPLLNRALIVQLRELLLAHPNSGDPNALFWPGRTHGPHTADWSRPVDGSSFLRHYFKPALARLRMPIMRVHDLRHTYASLMLAAGFKPYEVSRWMGHANVATTDAIYAHLYPSDYTDQIAKFEAYVTEV